MAGSRQAIAELDVLDRWPGVESGIEAAKIEKDLAADHSATRPERVHWAGIAVECALLVHEVMQQVAELAHNVSCRRVVVVGTEQGGEAWVGDKTCHAAAQGIGMDRDVRVQEENERRLGKLSPAVARGRGTKRTLVPGNDCTHVPSKRTRTVGRAIIDYDQLEIRPG